MGNTSYLFSLTFRISLYNRESLMSLIINTGDILDICSFVFTPTFASTLLIESKIFRIGTKR
jgi:hypothetical protein